MARRKIVAGNWKMNKTPSEAVALVNELKPLVANDEVDVVFCVPAIDIIPVAEAVKGTNIQVGAENMYFEESGMNRIRKEGIKKKIQLLIYAPNFISVIVLCGMVQIGRASCRERV